MMQFRNLKKNRTKKRKTRNNLNRQAVSMF